MRKEIVRKEVEIMKAAAASAKAVWEWSKQERESSQGRRWNSLGN
jgi:hypothetical protein